MYRRFAFAVGLAGLSFAAFATPCPKLQEAKSIAHIWQATRDCRIDTLTELVSNLPAKLRNNYLLAYSSRSLQEASHEYPRVIEFTPDINLFVAFNGHPSQVGYGTLEMIERNRRTKKFILRRIRQGASGKGLSLSEPNPALCLHCHGADPRPIFDGYFLWPGFYGSTSAGMDTTERRWLNERFHPHKSEPRYRALGAFPEHAARRMWSKLLSRNFERVARNLRSLPRAAPYRFALVHASGCPDRPLADALPTALLVKAPFDDKALVARVAKGFRDGYLRTRGRQQLLHGPLPSASLERQLLEAERYLESFTLANFLYLGAAVGFRLEDWALSLDRDYVSLVDGRRTIFKRLSRSLSKELLTSDERGRVKGDNRAGLDCKKLEAESLKALATSMSR